jgi:hypothetical protein
MWLAPKGLDHTEIQSSCAGLLPHFPRVTSTTVRDPQGKLEFDLPQLRCGTLSSPGPIYL